MSFEQAHNVNDVLAKIRSMVRECNRTDINDIVKAGIKQDLHVIKFMIEEALKACPEYPEEQEWLKHYEQKKLINILKGD